MKTHIKLAVALTAALIGSIVGTAAALLMIDAKTLSEKIPAPCAPVASIKNRVCQDVNVEGKKLFATYETDLIIMGQKTPYHECIYR